MWEQFIDVEPPYDFDQVLIRLSLDPLNYIDIQKKEVRVPVYAAKKGTIAELRFVGDREHPCFQLLSNNDEEKQTIINEISRIFRWNVSLKEIIDHFAKTNLKALFQEQEGTPLVCDFGLYSCLMKCIIHQQLNLKFAFTLTERFVHTYGFHIDGVWFYPTPEKVAEICYEELRKLQFSQRKAEYVVDTSKLIANDEVNLQKIYDKSNEEIMNQLVKIRGIGPWTVQSVLLFGLGRPNLLPATDIGIQNALKKFFQLEKKPSKEEIDKLSKQWSPYKSYASLYLWRSIEPKTVIGE